MLVSCLFLSLSLSFSPVIFTSIVLFCFVSFAAIQGSKDYSARPPAHSVHSTEWLWVRGAGKACAPGQSFGIGLLCALC
jgi:hypothetical protein